VLRAPAFEQTPVESGRSCSIVRATAFFTSWSGQIERARAGKTFLVVGDATLTSCKPISDDALGDATWRLAWTTRHAATACCRSAATTRGATPSAGSETLFDDDGGLVRCGRYQRPPGPTTAVPGAHQPSLPGSPLKGPARSGVTQPP
jgi:hypothetical protein